MRMVDSRKWIVYIIECADASLYTGITLDLDTRIALHNAGRAAKYTRGRGPVRLVYREISATRGEALSREIAIKRLPRAAKWRLIIAEPC